MKILKDLKMVYEIDSTETLTHVLNMLLILMLFLKMKVVYYQDLDKYW